MACSTPVVGLGVIIAMLVVLLVPADSGGEMQATIEGDEDTDDDESENDGEVVGGSGGD
jgi:hypothetical protein